MINTRKTIKDKFEEPWDPSGASEDAANAKPSASPWITRPKVRENALVVDNPLSEVRGGERELGLTWSSLSRSWNPASNSTSDCARVVFTL